MNKINNLDISLEKIADHYNPYFGKKRQLSVPTPSSKKIEEKEEEREEKEEKKEKKKLTEPMPKAEIKRKIHYAADLYYKLAKECLKGGLADNMDKVDFNEKELDKGIKIEMEHTDDPEIAKEIAKDHLKEMPFDYYRRLEKMEDEAKKENKFNESAEKQKSK